MSDGLSEGYRWARESEARQKKIDAFFALVADALEGKPAGEEAFEEAFRAFDAFRYQNHIAQYRLQKTVAKRWAAFQETLTDALRSGDRPGPSRVAWAKLLTAALEFGSKDPFERLHALSMFRGHRIALYIPNGRGREPTVLGDLAGALDVLATSGLSPTVVILEEPERAVVGLELGAKGKEIKESDRAKLRFLAVFDREGAA